MARVERRRLTAAATAVVAGGLALLADLGAAGARLATYAQNVNRVGSPEVYTGIATVLLGDRPATGRLPVPVGEFPIGHGAG